MAESLLKFGVYHNNNFFFVPSYTHTNTENVNGNHSNGFTSWRTYVSNDLEAQRFCALFTNKELQVSTIYFFFPFSFCSYL